MEAGVTASLQICSGIMFIFFTYLYLKAHHAIQLRLILQSKPNTAIRFYRQKKQPPLKRQVVFYFFLIVRLYCWSTNA
jgi:hypothetical protein